MTKAEYIKGYSEYSAKENLLERDFSKFAANCKEDGFNVTRSDYHHYIEAVKSAKKGKKLTEALFLNDDDDPRSFNDIYGEEGIPLDGDENTPATVENLGPAEIQQLRDLANQILAIVGTGTPAPDESMTGTPDFDEGEEE